MPSNTVRQAGVRAVGVLVDNCVGDFEGNANRPRDSKRLPAVVHHGDDCLILLKKQEKIKFPKPCPEGKGPVARAFAIHRENIHVRDRGPRGNRRWGLSFWVFVDNVVDKPGGKRWKEWGKQGPARAAEGRGLRLIP
ncbi:hypothetical protein ROR02_18060 [Pararhodospirillum oryzae]|uniref:Uncharacterized protein n=1 Tax=Pararhodospirillum oryzae TaxID=478448 RepID=A0A512H899_9PROT|nr:hypothetical protein ROR02_18060 [Pararhodospirillum oryzae]